MISRQLVQSWFKNWESGNTDALPLSEDFRHTSPFGTMEGKNSYFKMVDENKDKFMGYTFEIHDSLFGDGHACVRYTARQGNNFMLDVSEWFYFKDDLISEIISYYHIGEIKQDRQIDYKNH